MARKLTASDRKRLIRMASEMPAGSPERKAILSGLAKAATKRTDRRYVDSDDPRAVLRAWGGSDKNNATMDMGGWTGSESSSGDFIEAIQDESMYGGGSQLGYIVIEDMDGNMVDEL